MVKECALNAGNLPLGDLPRNSVVYWIIDCPDITLAVDHGSKVKKKTHTKKRNKQKINNKSVVIRTKGDNW